MIKTLLRKWFFAGSVSPVEIDKVRQAKLLRTMLLGAIIYLPLVIVSNLMARNIPDATIWLDVVMLVFMLFLSFLLGRGQVDFVSWAMVVSFFVFVVAVCFSIGTIRAPTTSAFIVAVILARIFFDLRGTIFVSVASSLAILGLVLAEKAGMLPTPDFSVTVTQWLTYTFLICISSILLNFSMESTQKALIQAGQELRERKQVEVALKNSQTQLKMLTEATQQAFLLMDRSAKILVFNRNAAQLAGFISGEEMREGDSIYKFIEVAEQVRFSRAFNQVLEGKAISVETSLRAVDGEYYWFAFEYTPAHAENNVVGVCLNASDITRRKRVEDRLHILSRAVEQSPASIMITNLAGNIEYVNTRFVEVTGYSVEEAIGKNPRMLKTEYTSPNVHLNLWETLKSGKEWQGEFVNRKKDGSVFYESVMIAPITDGLGHATHYLAVKEDITERKQVEDALRTSEARFRYLFEQSHDAVFILNLEGFHVAVNQRAADMLGYSAEEILQLSVKEVSAESPKSQDVMTRLLAGEQIPLYERLFRKKSGEVFPVEINLELVRDYKGSPLHIQSVVRDISQRKRAELELKTANEQLQLRVAEVEKLQDELREQALRDPLTGLYNRRYLDDALMREVARANRERKPISIVAMDIDHFKRVNDTYGHQVGDMFLVKVGSLIKQHTRGFDFVCRYGGEEFLLVMPGASIHTAEVRAEEIRQRVMSTVIENNGQNLSVTISLGLANYPEHGQGAEAVIIKADKALYHSKHTGRNRVTVWRENELVTE